MPCFCHSTQALSALAATAAPHERDVSFQRDALPVSRGVWFRMAGAPCHPLRRTGAPAALVPEGEHVTDTARLAVLHEWLGLAPRPARGGVRRRLSSPSGKRCRCCWRVTRCPLTWEASPSLSPRWAAIGQSLEQAERQPEGQSQEQSIGQPPVSEPVAAAPTGAAAAAELVAASFHMQVSSPCLHARTGARARLG